MKRILVAGGTGTVGSEVVRQLTPAGAFVRSLVRNPGPVNMPPGVEVVRGDLTVPEGLERPLEGIDSVFLVWTAPPAAFAPALEVIARHARRIVFLSAPLKMPHRRLGSSRAGGIGGRRLYWRSRAPQPVVMFSCYI